MQAMRKITGIATLVVLAAWGLSSAAYAKMSDEECAQHVGEMCGNKSLSKCFDDASMWEKIPQECTGITQTNIEGEREATEQGTAEPEVDTQTSNLFIAVGHEGLSYGGQLRKGPGMEFAKQASLAKGDKIKILEDTGVIMDGYKWFKVSSPKGVGYHWGGIFCVPGGVPADGVLDNCELMDQ
jgi:hypothetical protein